MLTLREALLGFTKTIKHLDGHEVTLKRSAPTQPGFVMTVADEGMPLHETAGEYGSLFVEFNVLIPTTISESQAEVFAKIIE